MPEFFKPEITEKRGKDDVDIKEVSGTDTNPGMDKITSRPSDTKLVDKAVADLRMNVLRLNNKLKEAQGVLGYSFKGLSDSEIAVAAKLVTAKLNALGAKFLNEAEKLSYGDFSRKASEDYDKNKANLMNTLLINPLNTYLNSELQKVIAAADKGDGDEIKTAEVLNKPGFKHAYTQRIDNAGKEEYEKHASN